MRRFLGLVVLLSLQVEIPHAWACSCAATSPVEAMEQSGVAYVGEVVGTGITGCGQTRNVRVEVVEAIVGAEVGETITREVNVGDGASCGMEYPFERGQRWILYGGEQMPLSLCSPDQPYDDETWQDLLDAAAE